MQNKDSTSNVSAKKEDRNGGGNRRSSSGRRSSLFQKFRQSFVRSGGDRGASVDMLRGTTGADFESPARVIRGAGYGFCCGLGGGGKGGKSGRKERFILIKGGACFVFSSEDAEAPKYAVELAHTKANVHEPGLRGQTTVSLETSLGDTEYEFIFHSNEVAREFASVAGRQARVAEQDIARKRLGHGHLLNKRASVRYAESIAEKKAKDQPEAPVTANDVMAAMPTDPSGDVCALYR